MATSHQVYTGRSSGYVSNPWIAYGWDVADDRIKPGLGETTLILFLLTLACSVMARAQILFDVMDFGAIGDGIIDDSQAFLKAWQATCNTETDYPTMVIPKKTFLLRPPVTFQGPCKSWIVNVQIIGTIVAPESIDAWKGLDPRGWITFQGVEGLILAGGGMINGRGFQWWQQSCRYNTKAECLKFAPTALRFLSCARVGLKNLKLKDSPNTHILIEDSRRFKIRQIYITAPEKSPNTDGIHIHASRDINLKQLAIGTGDDCISIGDRLSNINISQVHCGPGHGISIGSLGRDTKSMVQVKNIHVRDVHFNGTTNGVRIKTWQGAHGYARNISFKNVHFTWVDNPIIIDQYYCSISRACKNQTEGVKISDVSYKNMRGTSSTDIAINFMCSETVACTRIHLQDIRLGSIGQKKTTSAYCFNAHGSIDGIVVPTVPCFPKG
ncbi:hypothetical protein ACLOJK_020142 [Asimina triloba]